MLAAPSPKLGILLFGSRFQVKSVPEKEDAFDAIVTNCYYAAFDNADTRVKWLPDRLAVCATGGVVPKRVLYTTNELADFPIDCFVGITSRTPHFRRDDVADRLLINRVKRIGERTADAVARDSQDESQAEDQCEGRFLAEEALVADLVKHRPRILSSVARQIQDCIGALKRTARKEYRTSFRMADFATFCLRIADAAGNRERIEETFRRMSDDQSTLSLDGDDLIDLLMAWVEKKENQGKETTAKDLFCDLRELAEKSKRDFPFKGGRSLGQRLAHIETNLRTLFKLKMRTDPHKKQKLYRFWPKEGDATAV